MAYRGKKNSAIKHTPEGLALFREKLAHSAAYIVIINALHQRGELQQVALEVLDERRLWLTEEMKVQAGLARSIKGGGIIDDESKILAA